MIRAAIALLALTACNATPPAPVGGSGYRDRAVPIGTIAMFDSGRFDGNWHVVARYATAFEGGCAAAQFRFDGAEVAYQCRDSDGAVRQTAQGRATIAGPGRFDLALVTSPDPANAFPAPGFWILWVDQTYRTAVIGTLDGQAGWILNRDPRIPADRLAAAREILDFNGYRLAALQGIAP